MLHDDTEPQGVSSGGPMLLAPDDPRAVPLLAQPEGFPPATVTRAPVDALVSMLQTADTPYAAGLVPANDLIAAGRARVIPGIGLAAEGPSRLECVAPAPQGPVDVLYYGPGGRAAGELAALVLAEREGALPRLAPLRPERPGPGGAIVLTGADAWRATAEPGHALDLGAAWHALTGLPLVLLMWIVSPRAHAATLRRHCARAAQQGCGDLGDAAAGAAVEWSAPADEARACFDGLTYAPGEREMESLRLLAEWAHRHGLRGDAERLVFC
jgi:hypothetical protein